MKEIALYYIVGQQIFQGPLWKDLAAAKVWQTAAAIRNALTEFYEVKEAITDQKREISLADRREDLLSSETILKSLATLEKQFESVQRPQPRV